jgi:hypothetical protein
LQICRAFHAQQAAVLSELIRHGMTDADGKVRHLVDLAVSAIPNWIAALTGWAVAAYIHFFK